jgi:hypothetical protein
MRQLFDRHELTEELKDAEAKKAEKAVMNEQ